MKKYDINKKNLKVLHSSRLWLQQTQTWLYNQVRFLPDEIENHIVCEDTENIDQFRIPNIHSLAKEYPIGFFFEKRFEKTRIRRYQKYLIHTARIKQADIIHSHFGNNGWYNLKAASITDSKHVVTFYGYDLNMLPTIEPIWNERYQELFDRVECVLCEGPHMARCIINLGCPEHKVRVHHLGIAVDEIQFNPRVWSPKKPLRVLIAAAFREKKGIPYALEALGKFQHKVPLEITIIGDATNEDRCLSEKQKILSIIEKYHLNEKTRMLGYQPHSVLFEEAYKHHIFVSPSVSAYDGDAEGGAPVTIIEMAATGLPVVSTNHCDIPEVIESGKTGFLAKERNVDELVHYLQWLTDHFNQWNVMLLAGRKRIEAKFCSKIQGNRLAGIYRELCNRNDGN